MKIFKMSLYNDAGHCVSTDVVRKSDVDAKLHDYDTLMAFAFRTGKYPKTVWEQYLDLCAKYRVEPKGSVNKVSVHVEVPIHEGS